MTILASIEFINFEDNSSIETVPEEATSVEDAQDEFRRLSDVIGKMKDDLSNIVLETTDGFLIIPATYLKRCIIKLKISEENN